MDKSLIRTSAPAVTDVYTNLHGLQNLKTEENNDVALKKVAQQFESMFINMLLKNMRAANAVFSEGNMFDSNESKFYRDMHDNQLALSLAHGRGFGVADAMFRQLSKNHGEKSNQAESNGGDVKGLLAGSVDREPLQSAKVAEGLQLPSEPQPNYLLEGVSRRAKSHYRADQTAEQVRKSFSKVNGPSGETSTDIAQPNLRHVSAERSEVASSPSEFIHRVTKAATIAAQALGVDKEILIAQAALETGWGRHVFADDSGKSSFNMFNIKADSRWQGQAINRSSLEYLGGQLRNTASAFRAYDSIEASFKDYTAFILNNKRYQSAHSDAKNSLDYIAKIHQAGYATDPEYSDKIAAVYGRIKTAFDSPITEAKHSDE